MTLFKQNGLTLLPQHVELAIDALHSWSWRSFNDIKAPAAMDSREGKLFVSPVAVKSNNPPSLGPIPRAVMDYLDAHEPAPAGESTGSPRRAR